MEPEDVDPAPARVRLAAGLAVAALLTVLMLVVVARCRDDPGHPYLVRHDGAEWILYPTPPRTAPHLAVERRTTYTRGFELATVPAEAPLCWRAFRSARISVNGAVVHTTELLHADWKREREVDVAPWLVAGRNRLEVEVSNDLGPPALWLALDAGATAVRSDAEFEASAMGARWRPARPASLPMSAWSSDGAPERAPIRLPETLSEGLVALAVAVGLGLLAGLWFARRRTSGPPDRGPGADRGGGLTRRERAVAFGLVALAWIALFGNNAERVVHVAGFDAEAHAEYVELVRGGHLPLADEGWETYQPPLYYALAAGLLKAVGHTALEPAGVAWLRYLAGALGLLQVLLAFRTVQLLFPRSAVAQLAGLALAAFLPAELYVLHYVSNEGLAGVLATLVVWLTVRALKAELTAARAFALGAALGAALLAKFSALILLPVVLVCAFARERTRGTPWRGLVARAALVALGTLLVSGWHFARVWRAFGRPLVGNWDVELGFGWWQDPGFHEVGYYGSFGRSLVRPIFAGFHSFADALHSTLWGDALLGGSASAEWLLPWRPGAMAWGYVLALVPAGGLLLGALVLVARWIRRPSAEVALVTGAVGAVLFAVLFMTTQLPYYAQARAIYALSALAPLACLVAAGLDVVAGRSRVGAGVVVGCVVAWSAVTWTSFLAPDDARTHAALALALAERSPRDAEASLERALARSPAPGPAAAVVPGPVAAVVQRARARVAWARGDWDGAVEASRRAIEFDPTFAGAHVQLATAELERGRADAALAALVQASRVDPDSFEAAANRGSILRGRPGAGAEAEVALRDALRIDPQHAGVHALLAALLEGLGRSDEARVHRRWSIATQVAVWKQAGQHEDAIAALGEILAHDDDPVVSLLLADLLATAPDPSLRDGPRAVELALAVGDALGGDERVVATRAAAYAAAGRFEDAVRTQRELVTRYAAEGAVPRQVRARLARYEDGRPLPVGR